MRIRVGPVLLAAILVIAGGTLIGEAAHGAPGDEPDADGLLWEMGEYLKSAGEFAFHADVSYDSVLVGGERIQYGGSVDFSVRRPNRLRAEYRGDERQTRIVFDGSRATMLDLAAGVYAVTEVPPDLDAALDLVFEKYGFSVPVADLVYSDPYAVLTGSVEVAFIAGLHKVNGTPCHHLVFVQEDIDWQIWIADGPRPVPLKLVLTYKNEPGSPQYTARFSDWDFQPRIADRYFRFHKPPGAGEMEFLPSQQAETE